MEFQHGLMSHCFSGKTYVALALAQSLGLTRMVIVPKSIKYNI